MKMDTNWTPNFQESLRRQPLLIEEERKMLAEAYFGPPQSGNPPETEFDFRAISDEEKSTAILFEYCRESAAISKIFSPINDPLTKHLVHNCGLWDFVAGMTHLEGFPRVSWQALSPKHRNAIVSHAEMVSEAWNRGPYPNQAFIGMPTDKPGFQKLSKMAGQKAAGGRKWTSGSHFINWNFSIKDILESFEKYLLSLPRPRPANPTERRGRRETLTDAANGLAVLRLRYHCPRAADVLKLAKSHELPCSDQQGINRTAKKANTHFSRIILTSDFPMRWRRYKQGEEPPGMAANSRKFHELIAPLFKKPR